MSFEREFQHLQISLKDIILATNTFADDHCIGGGGFGKVYKGELLLSCGFTMVAIKRLDRRFGQGANEFWKEITLLSQYKHDNLVSLVGFCVEGDEWILVYEYLSNESLDKHLKSNCLSWKQRIRICIGATHGLQYLHDPSGTQQRVLHRDIKSANILLDANWNAKISDFGLSKISPANQKYTFIVSNAVGTSGYCDPLYMKTGCLTKESDIYSLGVVFFEVLCGRFCIENHDDSRRFLAKWAQQCYEEKKLDTIIMSSMMEQIQPECLQRFSTIAYQCLHRDRTKRPLMVDILQELEIALQYQVEYEFEKEKETKHDVVLEFDSDEYWERKLPRDVEVIIKKLNVPHSVFNVKKELFSFLNEGIYFDQNKRFFWINDDGKKCEFISSTSFLKANNIIWLYQRDLRFPVVAEFHRMRFHDIRCQIRTSMLSLGITYAATLVFKYNWQPNEDPEWSRLFTIKWKVEDLSVISSHNAELTTDNWYKMKLWHFTNHVLETEFDIIIEEISYMEDTNKSHIMIQGFEFHPIGMKIQQEDIEESTTLSKRTNIGDEDVCWEKMFPSDYQHRLEVSDSPLSYTTKKELYFQFCAGFLGCKGRLWFSLCKYTGATCCMLSASEILSQDFEYLRLSTLSLDESRFGEVKQLHDKSTYYLRCRLQSIMFSPQHIYACYLVFKFPDNFQLSSCFFKAVYRLDWSVDTKQVCISSYEPHIPTIKPKNDNGSHGMFNIPRMPKDMYLSWIQQRNDGWMEIRLCDALSQLENHKSLVVDLKSKERNFHGIIVDGIEFRPI